MSFLTPWVAAGIAAVVVPALVLLYFLKLRRRQEQVASTFLWKRAVREMQVNAPFQRLRKNLLLLLQLLVLAAGVFALARPVVESKLANEDSVVILIDRSASMNALDEDGQTRLDIAKEQAVRLARTFNQAGSRWLSWFGGVESLTRVMVIAFGDRASVVSPFTTSIADVVDRIKAIEPTDGRTNLPEALDLAEAYMKQTRIEQTSEPTEKPSSLVLISDGCVPDMSDTVLRAQGLRYDRIGTRSDNVGVTALRIQRNYETPELLSIFLQVQNFSPKPMNTDVSIYVDGVLQKVRAVSLGAARSKGPATDTQPAEDGDDDAGEAVAAMRFELELARAAVLEARLSRVDALAADNSATVVVPAPRKLRVLLVSKKNFFLENVLKNLPIESFNYITPEEYEDLGKQVSINGQLTPLETNGQSNFDVVVLDKHNTARLPVGNYFFVNSLPEIDGVSTDGEVGYHAMMWWDETHPVLRHVALDYVMAAKGLKLHLPDDAQTLIEGPDGPVLARMARDGRQYLILAFAFEVSTWWEKPGFPVFMYNAVRFLGAGEALGEDEPLRPGDTLRVSVPPEADSTTLTLPGGKTVELRPDEFGIARYAGTEHVGLYTAKPGIEGRDKFAVNLEDAAESAIAPRDDLGFNPGVQVEHGELIRTSTPEVWRWFVGAALLIALIEWIIYNRRVML